MDLPLHSFHIPVMGTGHSIDSPIRVAPFGISSVISLVDDILIERINRYYCELYKLPFVKASPKADDARAQRITAYLNTVLEIVTRKLEAIKQQPFFADNDKKKYFDLLPDTSPLKKAYTKLLSMQPGHERGLLEQELTNDMQAGSIDVNIMVKLDRMPYKNGAPLSPDYSDAKTALKGFADSQLNSALVLSAGINTALFNYMTKFKDFYRDTLGNIKKQIILKVSDFRSAHIQGTYLARKGLEVSEFRIESGLNCGGHAFPSNGILLPTILKEFKKQRDRLATEFNPMVRKFYNQQGWKYPEKAETHIPRISVQGGISTSGEDKRMREDFGIDMTGWATPFLLVPEATCVDEPTRELLKNAGDDQLYLSDVSPIGIPFNNIRQTGSEKVTLKRIAEGKPGSPCPKGYLQFNTEFTDKPICLASREYQEQKLEAIKRGASDNGSPESLQNQVMVKTCICHHLGNGALLYLGIANANNTPQAICPGPNIAWFDRFYTLQEMTDHIYGRCSSLISADRPHMFAKEIELYVDYAEQLIENCDHSEKALNTLKSYKENLEEGMDFCLEIAKRTPYPDENLASIPTYVEKQRARLQVIFEKLSITTEAT